MSNWSTITNHNHSINPQMMLVLWDFGSVLLKGEANYRNFFIKVTFFPPSQKHTNVLKTMLNNVNVIDHEWGPSCTDLMVGYDFKKYALHNIKAKEKSRRWWRRNIMTRRGKTCTEWERCSTKHRYDRNFSMLKKCNTKYAHCKYSIV